MNRKKSLMLKLLTIITLLLLAIFMFFSVATFSKNINLTVFTDSAINEIFSFFSPGTKTIYWGYDNQFMKSLMNFYSPANKIIYEDASIEAATCPAGYLNYYYAITKSEQTGVAKEIATTQIIDETSKEINLNNSYTLSQLMDYTFLINEFYTVDRTTYIDEKLLDSDTLLNTDLRIDKSKSTILIYHTHSQEAFVDSKENDPNTSIVAVGEYLAKLLSETYGFNVIHNTKVYDLKDGKLDRNKAYTYAGYDLEAILEEHPEIEVIIDLHRDGVDGEKMTTDINGKETAKLMFFNGLSRTVETGEIEALYNPNLSGNLAMSLQAQLVANEKYPGLMRHIYLKGYQYNLHMKPRSLLIEAGSQKNTFQEMLNSMEPLADILNDLLTKEAIFSD